MSDVVEELNTRSSDFGGMIRRMPRAVATPRSAEELTDLVRKASRDGTRLAVRGGGHSQGGQCLTDGGLVIDTMYLDRIEIRGDDLVRTQGGTPWSKVVDALRGSWISAKPRWAEPCRQEDSVPPRSDTACRSTRSSGSTW
ncbi:MAG: FAD-dependent oxidoreductase [Pseudomonadales bacterium]|nr:FAD-dependent oxidoreductase [Pseudomonadales bacterium]